MQSHGIRTWVLLRGLGREAAHWYDFLPRFKSTFPDDRILTPDLPGAGKNREMNCSVSIHGMAEWVRRECSVSTPVHLLGISLGGMVALDWAERRPKEVAGLVLINTSVSSLSPLYRRFQPQIITRFLKSLKEKRPFEREKVLLSFISNLRCDDDALAHRFAEIAQERPVSRMSVLRQLYAASRFKPGHAVIKGPGLVLVSAKDRMVHPDCSRAIAMKWGFERAEHPLAGHDIPIDDGDWVIRQVKDWLSRLK